MGGKALEGKRITNQAAIELFEKIMIKNNLETKVTIFLLT